MKKIGIVAHGAEGAALCYITACREGQRLLGAHMHPEIIMDSTPLGLSLDAFAAGDHDAVGRVLRRSIETLADAGADFFICPNNTAHPALERITDSLPIPGLHIAEVVAAEIRTANHECAGLLGSEWTMTGALYPSTLAQHGIDCVVPNDQRIPQINRAILDELCQGRFIDTTTDMLIDAINELRASGADCVILGCTELPLVIDAVNSPLPPLDSTRLLARYAVAIALAGQPVANEGGWLNVRTPPALPRAGIA